MILLRIGLACVLLGLGGRLHAAEVDRMQLDKISEVIHTAIQRNDIPGAVVLVLHGDDVVFRKAYGNRAVLPEKSPMAPDAIFDMASLTKPIATGTCIMQLAEQGKLAFSDPVAKHWPAFAANGKETVTIEHCLLHVSGLIPDNAIGDYSGGHDQAMAKIAALKLEASPGTRFRYSDVGFIVLGELVKRISGLSVDEYASRHVFKPLKMNDTGYNPAQLSWSRIAPTGKRKGKIILGQVHDPRAFALDGVAGHAGLFSTADDVARYCRMLMHEGELDGVRVLKKETVKWFTEPLSVVGTKKAKWLRSRGWDVDTAYSSQRGERFPRDKGFGHTGFTGTSVWVDVPSRTAVIVLTNRVHPDDKGNTIALRRSIGTIVGSAVKP